MILGPREARRNRTIAAVSSFFPASLRASIPNESTDTTMNGAFARHHHNIERPYLFSVTQFITTQESQSTPIHLRAAANGNEVLSEKLLSSQFSPVGLKKPSAPHKMAQANNSPKAVVAGFTGVGALNPTFANSKFFLKKQNRSAVKIQAIVRAFIVQARIFRQRKLEPLEKDLENCEHRKLEELHFIEEQKKIEMEQLPAQIVTEQEESHVLIDSLKRDIEDWTEWNKKVKAQNKELKKNNKELEKKLAASSQNDFRLDVQKTKLTQENKKLEADAQYYKDHILDIKCYMDNKDRELNKVAQQKEILRKYVRKIIKLVESKVEDDAPVSPPSKKASSPTKKTSRRRSLVKASSVKKMPREEACYDWATNSYDWSKQPFSIDLDEEKEEEKERGIQKRRGSSHQHRTKKNTTVTRDLLQEIKNIKRQLVPV